jgi:hypothetical protein
MSVFGKLAVVAFRQLAGQAKSTGSSEILRSLAAQAQRPAAAPAPAPPAGRDRWLGHLTYWGFLLGVALMLASLLGLVLAESGALWLSLTKLAVGVVLVGEGFLLLADWHGARRYLLAHLRARGGTTAEPSHWNNFFWRAAGPGLGLVGLIWIAMGVFALAQGTVHLVPGG